jgi:hypothetical protein
MHEDKEYIKVTFDDIIDSKTLDKLDKKENKRFNKYSKLSTDVSYETSILFAKKFMEKYFSNKK